jgi:general secretion pathway protein M
LISALPTGRRGRLLALSLLLIALAGAYLLVVAPVVELYAERQAGLEDRRTMLPHLLAAADELPVLRARVAQLRAAVSLRKVTLEGASDAIASADLESRIDTLATSVGATIGSTEALPAEARGDYRRIGLRLALSGSYETLVKLIARIEAATPPLIVDNLQIHGVLRRPGLPQEGGEDSALDAGFDVFGFRRNATPAARKP